MATYARIQLQLLDLLPRGLETTAILQSLKDLAMLILWRYPSSYDNENGIGIMTTDQSPQTSLQVPSAFVT
ncbi:hypothetical protein VTN77DRAFT_9369 [Rasamsonia byssochlamydoides]|uniref:uncharacterized protein n=1 Tax=Rasamsonia byssochlamydoides TaxID=89139 RepID=UPI0037420346